MIKFLHNILQKWKSLTHLMVIISIILSILFDTLAAREVINVGLKRIPGHDFIRDLSVRDVSSVLDHKGNLEGKPGQGYYLEAQIGTPPQKLNVLIDTGSSNFAIAASPNKDITKYFHRDLSTTYQEIGTTVFVPYTQGNWKGVLGTDLVTLTSLPGVSVRSNIAFITHSSNFFINGSNWQGILGLAYSEIARPDKTVVPYFDALVGDGGINNLFALQLCGTVYKNVSNIAVDTDFEMGGTMSIGGIDSSLYTGKIFYTNLYKEWYYEVTIVDMEVNGQSLKMDCKEYNFPKTIVDSGTTNLRLPDKVFNKVVAKIKKFTSLHGTIPPSDDFWTGKDNLCWKENHVPYADFPTISLSFAMGTNSTFKLILSPQQYIRAIGEDNDEAAGEDCFKFGISGSQAGTVIGAVVMEGYYVIFDRVNKKIGFADSTCPVRDSSVFKSTVKGPFTAKGNLSDCAYVKVVKDEKTLTIVAYVMAGICCVCLLPLIIMVIHWQCHKCRNGKRLDRQHSDTNDLMADPN